jgi:hypothetical protein
MPDDFDPYYLWLGIPPDERPANHYRLLGITLFEENPRVIEGAADRQMAHLRSVQAGKHSVLSQRLLNEVAAARVCLLRAPQKAKYDQALRAKLESQAAPPPLPVQPPTAAAALVQPKPIAQAQPMTSNVPPSSGSESFWEDLTGSGAAQTPANPSKPQPRATAPRQTKQLRPVFLAVGACLLIGVVVVGMKAMSGKSEEATTSEPAVQTVAAKPKESLLIFDWPADERIGLTLLVDGEKVTGPAIGPWEHHCLPGPHHVVATRAGFKTIDKTVDAPSGGRRNIADAWQPNAILVLNWPVAARDGAVLYVDGQSLTVGSDQLLSVPVDSGTHTVRVVRPGFMPFERNITVASDQRQGLLIALRPAATVLTVRLPLSERAGAELRIDGVLHSTASMSNVVNIALNPGPHSILITRPGFQPFMRSVMLGAAGKNVIAPIWLPQLKPPTATTAKTEVGPGDVPNAKVPTVAAGDSVAPVRHAAPSSVDQMRVAKQLDQIYKPTHDAAKDLAQAKELCNLALKAEELAERYMLLLKGADFAVEGGDISLALQAVDTLDAEFAIVALDLKEKLLERVVKVASNADQVAESVSAAERLIDDAIAADRFDMATLLAASASKLLLKKFVEPDFRHDTEKTLAAYRAQIKALQPQWEAAQKAKQAHDSKPDDPDANGTLGRWYCFYKGDWKLGLPFLAKSGSERLKPIAEQELQSPTDAAQTVQLADQWWEIAQKETGVAADAIHLHAGELYRSAMPNLNSVLKKAAVEKRLAEVAEIRSRVGDSSSGQHSGPIIFQRGRSIDVLKLVDVARDHVGGNWSRHGSEIICDGGAGGAGGAPRIVLPVVLDGGYDLEVDFTRSSGAAPIHTIFQVGRQSCGLTLNSGIYSGFDSIDGKTFYQYFRNPYASTGASLQNGHKYQEIINVRLAKNGAASVDVSIDGKQFLTHWEGDPSVLGVDTRFHPAPKQPALEVGFGAGSVTFHAVRLRMVSGQGRFETSAADQPPNQGDASASNKSGVSPPKVKFAPGT